MKMVFVLAALATMLFAALATCSLDPSASALAGENPSTSADLDLAARHVDAMGVGSLCPGSEGAWFCMSSSFQRCASGQWSAALACAPGTVCQPEGLTYDMQSAFGGIDPAATVTSSSTCSAGAATDESSSSSSGEKTTETTGMAAAATTTTDTAAKTVSCSGAEPTTCTTGCAAGTAIASTSAPKKDSSDAPRSGVGFFLWGLVCAGSLSAVGGLI